MIQDARRVRLLWLTLACATLAACGGGGGGAGSPPPAPPPPPPASESAYLLAEFVAGDSNNQYVRVWDPAQPTVAVQNIKLVMGNGIIWTSSHLVFSDATHYDAGTRTVTTLGHAKVFFDNDGKLYSIDLRGGQSHAPVQLSSAADVFLPRSAIAMNAAGDDAWVDVQGGVNDWAVRTTMSTSTAPVLVNRILAPLRDPATGLPQYLFASVAQQIGTALGPVQFEVVDPSFTVVPDATVATMAAGDMWLAPDPAQSGTGYVVIANQLHQMHWSSSGVSVDAGSLYSFTYGTVLGLSTASDSQSLYVTNGGGGVVAVTHGAVRTVGTLSGLSQTIYDAGDYIAAIEMTNSTTTQSFHQLETLRKSDGLLTLVEGSSSTLELMGASTQGLIIAGSATQPQSFVLASGDNASRSTFGTQPVGVVVSATAPLDRPAAPVALLACVSGTDVGTCAPGALTQLDFSGNATSTLGTLAASAPRVRGDAIAGAMNSLAGQTLLSSPAGFAKDQTDKRDAWQFTPSTAGSVARVTTNLP